jgi:hypothetical protein
VTAQALVILFALFTAPDGARTPADVAITRTREACELIAQELNASSRKPKDVEFMCREGKLPVKS